MVKSPSITSSDVSTHFRPVLKSRLEGLTFAEAPPSAISRPWFRYLRCCRSYSSLGSAELRPPAHVNVFFTLCRSSLTNVTAKMDLMERKFRRCLRSYGGANVHSFFSRYVAERSGRTETLTSRTAANETASTSTASASRSQRTARKSFALSSVGRSFCTRFSSPLTSAHARPKRNAPHEET